MKILNIITLLLVIVGGLNWGLVGLAEFDLVAALFGGQLSTGAKIVYILVGLSAVWQLIPFFRSLATGEVPAQANTPGTVHTTTTNPNNTTTTVRR